MRSGLLISHCHGHGHGYGVLGSEVAFLSSFVLISSFPANYYSLYIPYLLCFRPYPFLSFETEASLLAPCHFQASSPSPVFIPLLEKERPFFSIDHRTGETR